MTKVCRDCQRTKPVGDFYSAKRCIDGTRPECRTCFNADRRAHRLANLEKHKATVRRRYHANPDKHRAYGRARYQAEKEWRSLNYTLSRYGLTIDQYHAMQERQDFACAICGDVADMHIDHCHTTDKIRGLLCAGCNIGIGHFRERPAALVAAASYVAA
jgi:hypothetical protein